MKAFIFSTLFAVAYAAPLRMRDKIVGGHESAEKNLQPYQVSLNLATTSVEVPRSPAPGWCSCLHCYKSQHPGSPLVSTTSSARAPASINPAKVIRHPRYSSCT
ncbi:trypsin-3-like protein [Lates japonicus]|uniref:Trypsin-3-like protein n=1 Tax=Lates japonicus TaxID=270547 RepID=A0AAD3RD10_LATJO|nr:trypsin-3-like protein [Lates japonicus]